MSLLNTTDFAHDPNQETMFSSIAKSAIVQKDADLEHPVHLAPQSEVHNASRVGRCSFINIRSVLYPHVAVGRFCSVARNCEIGVAAHPMSFLSTHSFQYHGALFPAWDEYKHLERTAFRAHQPTVIGNDVWIGAQCTVLAGVTIGDGAVIAANSVVSKDIEPYAIVGGSPAKMIRPRFPEHQVAALLALRWWELPLALLSGVPFESIDRALEVLAKRRAAFEASDAAKSHQRPKTIK